MSQENIESKIIAAEAYKKAANLGGDVLNSRGEPESIISAQGSEALASDRILSHESITKPRVIPLEEIPGCIGSAEGVPAPVNWGWTK